MAAEKTAADLVEFIAKAMVNNPEAVSVSEVDDGRTLELETDPEDRGRGEESQLGIGDRQRAAPARQDILDGLARQCGRLARAGRKNGTGETP